MRHFYSICHPKKHLIIYILATKNGSKGARTPDLSRVRRTLIPAELCFRSTYTMRITGLEPARLLTIEPKSIASANSATPAYKITLLFYHKLPTLSRPFAQKNARCSKHRTDFFYNLLILSRIISLCVKPSSLFLISPFFIKRSVGSAVTSYLFARSG